METKQKSVFVKEIESLLHKYLAKDVAQEFALELEKRNLLTDPYSALKQSEKDAEQIQINIPHGTDERELIQYIISFTENKIPEELLLNLMLELSHLMIFNGELSFASEICEEILAKTAGNEKYYTVEADTSLALAKISWSQAYWEESLNLVKQSYDIYKSHNDIHGFAKCENLLGSIMGEQGKIIEAQEHFKQGLKYLTDIDDVSLRSMFEINMGILLNIQGEYVKAMWNFKNALNKCIQLNDTRRIARVRHNLGLLYTRIKDYQAAIEEFDKSISVSLEYGYLSNCAIGYIGKAFIYTKLNNFGLAEAFTDKALEIAYKINDALSIADIYKIKGMIQNNLMNYELSEELFENSIRLNEDFENQLNMAETQLELSEVYEKTERPKEAQELKDEAVGYYTLIKARDYINQLIQAQTN